MQCSRTPYERSVHFSWSLNLSWPMHMVWCCFWRWQHARFEWSGQRERKFFERDWIWVGRVWRSSVMRSCCSHNGSVLSVSTGRGGIKARKASCECDVSEMMFRERSTEEDVCDSRYLVSVQITGEEWRGYDRYVFGWTQSRNVDVYGAVQVFGVMCCRLRNELVSLKRNWSVEYVASRQTQVSREKSLGWRRMTWKAKFECLPIAWTSAQWMLRTTEVSRASTRHWPLKTGENVGTFWIEKQTHFLILHWDLCYLPLLQ